MSSRGVHLYIGQGHFLFSREHSHLFLLAAKRDTRIAHMVVDRGKTKREPVAIAANLVQDEAHPLLVIIR